MKFKIAAFADEASGSLTGQIEAMRQNGVSLLEIRGVDGENASYISKEKAGEIRKRLDNAGIGVWSLGSPFGKIGIGEDFSKHLDEFKRALELAEILGTKHIRLFSFYGVREVEPVLAKLEKFVDATEGTGIILCHENEKGIFGDVATNCVQIHRVFPQIRAVFDPANFVQCHEDTVKAWEMLAPYVEYMHIKDALSDGTVVPAGHGEGNLRYLLGQYSGEVVTVEPHLAVFEGFDKLEEGEKSKMQYTYGDSLTAFGVAVDALKDIIGR
ncbi:MAG: sugar phosphate isomerase/epimerase [Lachnospiraceae bacterium]|nr:sugar phosphate isomerase/epimerase [Lachnospiraceae bacterium]